MQDRETKAAVLGKQRELVGLPEGIKQYPVENGWLLVSSVGICFIPCQAPLIAAEIPVQFDIKPGKIVRK